MTCESRTTCKEPLFQIISQNTINSKCNLNFYFNFFSLFCKNSGKIINKIKTSTAKISVKNKQSIPNHYTFSNLIHEKKFYPTFVYGTWVKTKDFKITALTLNLKMISDLILFMILFFMKLLLCDN